MEKILNFYNLNKNYSYKFQSIPSTESEYDWITSKSKIPFLKINLDGPWKEILEEAKNLSNLFVSHRDDGHSKGWSSLCIHGLGAFKTDSPNSYDEYKNIPYDELPFQWTEIAYKCPITTYYFKHNFPYESYHRLRFMKLEAGGYIVPHTDSNLFNLCAVNISLNNPPNCEMILEGVGKVPFDDSGSVYALNTSYRHMVWNNSDIDRYHIIVHGRQKNEWEKIILDSYKSQLIL